MYFLTRYSPMPSRPPSEPRPDSLTPPKGATSVVMKPSFTPAGPVLETHEVVAHPHTLHREMTVDIDGFRTLGNPIKMSGLEENSPPPPPLLGQHTEEVLSEKLNLSPKGSGLETANPQPVRNPPGS